MFATVTQYLKSKTVIFGLLLAIASWLQTVLVNAPLPPDVLAIVGTAVGVAVVWLRSVTTKPIAEK